MWTGKIVQWIKVPATNPDDLSSVSGTLIMIEGEDQLL